MQIQKDLEKSLHYLQEGGIILYPTDTIWGIGCDATNSEAVQRIYALKKRAEEKTMIVLAADTNMLQQYVDIDELPPMPAHHKPLTIIYPHAKKLAQNLIADDGSIAIRIPNDEFCHLLIGMYGRPIVSTSANFSGSAAPRVFDEICEEIKSGVDYTVKHRQHENEPSAPSAIYKLEADGTYSVIRD